MSEEGKVELIERRDERKDPFEKNEKYHPFNRTGKSIHYDFPQRKENYDFMERRERGVFLLFHPSFTPKSDSKHNDVSARMEQYDMRHR